jgi:hypothetical protein
MGRLLRHLSDRRRVLDAAGAPELSPGGIPRLDSEPTVSRRFENLNRLMSRELDRQICASLSRNEGDRRFPGDRRSTIMN